MLTGFGEDNINIEELILQEAEHDPVIRGDLIEYIDKTQNIFFPKNPLRKIGKDYFNRLAGERSFCKKGSIFREPSMFFSSYFLLGSFIPSTLFPYIHYKFTGDIKNAIYLSAFGLLYSISIDVFRIKRNRSKLIKRFKQPNNPQPFQQ